MTMLLRFILRILITLLGTILFVFDVLISIPQLIFFVFTGKTRVWVLSGLVTYYIVKMKEQYIGKSNLI